MILKLCSRIHVERYIIERGIIYLDQNKYTQQVLQKYGMSDCKAVITR